MTLATADREGRPWATPVWYAHEGHDEFIWVSRPGTRHSQNLQARPEVAIVIFDSRVAVGEAEAVYVEARAEEVTGAAAEGAVAVFSRRSAEQGLDTWSLADVTEPAQFRIYRATASAHFLLGERDQRIPVTPGGQGSH